jgi:hypothetical protein
METITKSRFQDEKNPFELFKSEYSEIKFKDGLPIFNNVSNLQNEIICDSFLAKILNLKEGQKFVPAFIIYKLATEFFTTKEDKQINSISDLEIEDNIYFFKITNKIDTCISLFFGNGFMLGAEKKGRELLSCNQSLVCLLLKHLNYNIYGINCYYSRLEN